MENFNNDLFKEKSKVTYVWVSGKIVSIPNDNSSFFYDGYIEVPYSYMDFIHFNDKQQRAICQSVLLKYGIYFKFTDYIPNPDKFFTEE